MVSQAAPITAARILVVDDDPVAADALAQVLRRDGHDVESAHDGEAALDALEGAATRTDETENTAPFALVVTDLNMPRCDGLELLRRLRRDHRSVVPIVVTGFGRVDSAVEAVKLGAIDYLTKPIVCDDLRLAVNKAVHQHALLAENGQLRQRLDRHEGLGTLIGSDPRMARVFELIEVLGNSHKPALIIGEAGVGKTAVAHAIHRRAAAHAITHDQSPGPVVSYELGNHDEAHDHAALFGHTRGALPGIRTESAGKLGDAATGTLLITRLDRATPALQELLHRLIQTGHYQRVGAEQKLTNTARLIFTARSDLLACAKAGAFREDLAYQLQPTQVTLPPLRDRRGDIRAMADHFLERQGAELRKPRRLGDEALRVMETYAWPGNVRELERAIEHAVLMSRSPVIQPTDLPEAVAGTNEPPRPIAAATASAAHCGHTSLTIPALAGGWTPTPLEEALRPCEQQIILAALQANDWNRSETARQLDINRTTLYKKIRAYRLDEPA